MGGDAEVPKLAPEHRPLHLVRLETLGAEAVEDAAKLRKLTRPRKLKCALQGRRSKCHRT